MADTMGTASPQDRLDLSVIFKALLRGIPFILLISLIVAGGVFVFAMMQTPVFRAQTSLLVEDRENPFTRARGEQLQGNAPLADDSAISSQMQLLQTGELFTHISQRFDLKQTDEYQKALEPGFLGLAKALVGMGTPTRSEREIEDAVLQKLRNNVIVVRERDSRVITLLADSESPQLAADIANGLANEHVRRRSVSQAGDTLDATKWLEDEISKLRASVLAAETKVAQYRADNDLFRGPNNAAIEDRRLSDLSVQITQASGRRNVAESKAKLIRTLIQQGRPLSSVPDVQNSRLVQALTQQLVARRAEVAQLSATLLPGHPSIAGARAQVREIEGQIRREATQIAQTLETEARIETELVQNLRDEVARAKIGVSESQAKQVQLNELEREASAQRDLLNALLSRYREAASRSSSEANPPDIRVISAALVPTQPNAPKIVQMTILAFMGTLFLTSIWVMARAFPKATRVYNPAAAGSWTHSNMPDRAIAAQMPTQPVEHKRKPVVEDAAPVPARASAKATQRTRLEETHSRPVADLDVEKYAIEDPHPLPNPLAQFARKVRRGGENASPHPLHRLQDEYARGHLPRQTATSTSRGTKRAKAAGWRGELMAQISERAPGQSVLLFGTTSAKLQGNDCVLALAGDYAKNGAQCLVIDASPMRHPLELEDNIEGLEGLADLLDGNAEFNDVIHEDRCTGLSFIPTGTHALEMRQSDRMDILLDACDEVFDKILISTGAIGMTSSLPLFKGSGYATAILDIDGAREEGRRMITSHLKSFGLGELLFVQYDGEVDLDIA